MICIESVVEQRFPGFTARQPLLGKTLLRMLKLLCHEREFQQFEKDYPHLEGFDFLEQALNYFDFSFRVKDNQKERIPTHGRVVIIANHPIGSLDGLALLKMVGEIRRDVKVVANEILSAIKPLNSLLLPVDNMQGRSGKDQLRAIKHHLEDDGALIIFPAGEVSRMGPMGIRDGAWSSGFLRFASSANAPILPLFVDGRNSLFFYSLSLLAKPISTLWLIREMFKQANNHVDITVGNIVYPEQYKELKITPNAVVRLFKKHVYRLPKKQRSADTFASEYEAIAHPENRQLLRKEIHQCELLGNTHDGKGIYLYQYKTNSVILREIGRLREITFRSVKEGTGKRRDIDAYDSYYDHVILWDDQDLEIAGAYRMVRCEHAFQQEHQKPSLYTQTLFEFSSSFNTYFAEGLELGRSFVQPKYWGKRSIDYLWHGIGAYLNKYPDIRYLFGPVSISHEYSDEAKNLLISFYQRYFSAEVYSAGKNLARALNPYQINASRLDGETPQFENNDYRLDFCALKSTLQSMGHSVPTLYKQYTELCEPGGTQFIDFNLDKEFADCVDGLILIDIQKMKPEKYKRYIGKLTALTH